MNEDRNAQLSGRGPDRIETRVIDRDALSRGVRDPEPQALEDLEAPRARGHVRLELRRGDGPELGVVDVREVHVGEDDETTRIGRIEGFDLPRRAGFRCRRSG